MTDRELLDLAIRVSRRSPHPRTKVGSVLVDTCGYVVGKGWNDFPIWCADSVRSSEVLGNDILRTMYIIHAEQMCVANAARAGVRTSGCRIYQTILPCCECAKAIIQAGIAEVVVDAALADSYRSDRYGPQFEHSLRMFELAEVTFRRV